MPLQLLFLGGTSLSGGVGFVLPTVVGAMIMGIIDNILTLMNVNPHATNIVKGAVILDCSPGGQEGEGSVGKGRITD